MAKHHRFTDLRTACGLPMSGVTDWTDEPHLATCEGCKGEPRVGLRLDNPTKLLYADPDQMAEFRAVWLEAIEHVRIPEVKADLIRFTVEDEPTFEGLCMTYQQAKGLEWNNRWPAKDNWTSFAGQMMSIVLTMLHLQRRVVDKKVAAATLLAGLEAAAPEGKTVHGALKAAIVAEGNTPKGCPGGSHEREALRNFPATDEELRQKCTCPGQGTGAHTSSCPKHPDNWSKK
jgi:hypothetical protein